VVSIGLPQCEHDQHLIPDERLPAVPSIADKLLRCGK